MGCSWCGETDELLNDSTFSLLKHQLNKEYSSYLLFIKNLKSDLNSNINQNNNNQENSQINDNNKIRKKDFNLIPRNWFLIWEKRIEFIIENNKYKSFNLNFEYINTEDILKFNYELMDNELWSLIYRNKIYNLKVQTKIKPGLICNNLIIFQYTTKSNYIEIFFFKNDEDVYFTNLFFSFEKCEDNQKECMKLLSTLKKSPIQEILGNMHYDYTKQKFIEQNKKIIIYNKTSEYIDKIKNFRKNQYDKLFKSSSVKENDDEKNIDNNENNYNKKSIENYTEKINIGKILNNRVHNNINLYHQKMENSKSGIEISRASTIMMLNNQNIPKNINNISNISGIKINKYNLNDKKNESNISGNKFDDEPKKNSKNIIKYNNEEIPKKNDTKGINILRFLPPDMINKNFFECILYSLYSITKLTNYILNNHENFKNNINSFTNDFIRIFQFLIKNKNDSNNMSKNYFGQNLIKNCPFYNHEQLINLIKFENGNNIISKILNILHFELKNEKEEIEEIKCNYSQDIYCPEQDKIREYNNFIKKCQENNKSIIYDLFYGIKEEKIICNKCNESYYKFEMIDIIELSKEKIYLFHSENKINSIDNTISVSIEDCINYYKKEEKQQEKILFKCPICNECKNNSIFYDIIKYPENFILYFNDNSEKLNIIICEKLKILKEQYELTSILALKNKKENNKDDKYNVYFKNISNNKWTIYDDNKMKDIDINIYIENIEPIVVFYQKTNNKK